MRRPLLLLAALSLSACGRTAVQTEFHSALEANTIAGYEEFLTHHPESREASDARRRQVALILERDFSIAAKAGTRDAWRRFIVLHPNSWLTRAALAALATSLPDTLDPPVVPPTQWVERTKEAVQAAADAFAFIEAMESDDESALRDYLRTAGTWGPDSERVAQRLDQLEHQKAMPKPAFLSLLKGHAVDIAEGLNRRDIDADGVPDLVIKVWRDNNNAHGFYMFLFLLSKPSHTADRRRPFEVATIDEGPGDVRNTLTSFHGADCVLTNYRFLQGENGRLRILRASRAFADSFGNPARVRFELFDLVDNPEHAFGNPDVYFESRGYTLSRENYCDVNEAIARELGRK